MKKSLLILLFMLSNLLSVFGQKEERNKKSDYPFVKFELILDGRHTMLGNEGAKLGGLRLGFEINRVNRCGFGFYSFSNSVHAESLNEISSNIVSADLKLGYTSIYYERVLLFTEKYEWSSTLHLGYGNISGSYAYANGTTANYSEPIQLSELSTTFYRHLTYFISVGGGIGYRQTRNAPAEFLSIYNAPVLLIKLRFQPIKGVRGIWNKDIRKRY